MNDTANVSGAFERPTLIDYLLVAHNEQLDLGLVLHVGRFELGLVGVVAGRVVFAELPGSTGEPAFVLLAQMAGLRVVPTIWSGRPANIDRPWRELVAEHQLEPSPGRGLRLESIRVELAELFDEAKQSGDDGGDADADADTLEPGRDHSELSQVVAELLDWSASEACLREDVARAHQLLTLREQLCPTELICASNLERLRLRLLEDEIAAGVAGRTR